MTQPFDIDAMRADMEAGTPGSWRSSGSSVRGARKSVSRSKTYTHNNALICSLNNYEEHRRIARVPAMEAEILRLTAEVERLRGGINRAGALAMQRASHDFIRQVLADTLGEAP